jgi:hypothetical protein
MSECKVTLDESYIIIEELVGIFKKKIVNTFKIKHNKIITIEVLTEKNISEKSKSVVGRGLTGAVLFGPAGLILGGLSGTGTKKKIKTKEVFNISYYDRNNEIKSILFNAPGVAAIQAMSFARKYNEIYPKEVFKNEAGEILL